MLAGWLLSPSYGDGTLAAEAVLLRSAYLMGLVPGGERGVDDRSRCQKRGLYIHFGGVEQVRVGGGPERRVGAAAVALVAALDIGEDGGEVGGAVIAFDFSEPAPGADLGACRDIELHVGVGADHGAD